MHLLWLKTTQNAKNKTKICLLQTKTKMPK